MVEKQKNQGVQEKKRLYSEEELEKLVNERLASERKQWEEENRVKIADEREKAERLASLPEDERKRAKFDESVRLFEDEKKRYMSEKMEFETAKMLAEENLPTSFAKILAGETLDETTENVNNFKEEFLKEVESNLNLRLRGKTPMTSSVVENNDPFLAGFGN